MHCIHKYFTDLTDIQISRFDRLAPLYAFWNARINVISRKDMENFCIRHVLHSLSIAKAVQFRPGTRVVDAGTGGGFPGIPLAVLFPESEFTLVDSIAKKIKVVDSVVHSLGLTNCNAVCERIEKVQATFDFAVSRAVVSLPAIVHWVLPVLSSENRNSLNNGILCLKGGNLDEELKDLTGKYRVINVSDYFGESFFETKKIVYINAAL